MPLVVAGTTCERTSWETAGVGDGRPSVVFACFLPDASKRYVTDEIVQTVLDALGVGTAVYCGVQHGSDPATEEWLREAGPDLRWHFARVTSEMYIDSDAAAFIAGLALLRSASRTHSLCYFVHTKAITSGDDAFRRELLTELFAPEAAQALTRPGVGSFGPRLSIVRTEEDRYAMGTWLDRFVSRRRAVLPYFYAHTLWVARGSAVNRFLEEIDPAWFTTPIASYSDRYFAERDLPHLVDGISGLRPSFNRLTGNVTTAYHRTRRREYYAALAKWWPASRMARPARRLRPGMARPQWP